MKPHDDIIRILAVREGIEYGLDGKPKTVFNINYETDDHFIGRVIVPAAGLTQKLIMEKIRDSITERKWVI
jgi:hypothetical protein